MVAVTDTDTSILKRHQARLSITLSGSLCRRSEASGEADGGVYGAYQGPADTEEQQRVVQEPARLVRVPPGEERGRGEEKRGERRREEEREGERRREKESGGEEERGRERGRLEREGEEERGERKQESRKRERREATLCT